MNFGILMVQGLVNSFGATIMAAFAAAVKIDSFAYMPVQDFGNAFSTFIAQNYRAKETERIKKGIKSAITLSSIFCLIISFIIFVFAKQLMMIFVNANEKTSTKLIMILKNLFFFIKIPPYVYLSKLYLICVRIEII